jgi:hypothetical protein
VSTQGKGAACFGVALLLLLLPWQLQGCTHGAYQYDLHELLADIGAITSNVPALHTVLSCCLEIPVQTKLPGAGVTDPRLQNT